VIIQTKELEQILNEPNLVLIDTRSYKEYSENHIPGAINLDLFAFHWFDTSKKGIENFNAQTTDLFSFVGITNEKKVVFYDDVSGILAARGVWMLLHFSHPQVFMLDGGIQKWKIGLWFGHQSSQFLSLMYQTSEMQKGPSLLHQEYDSQNIPCMILHQSKQDLTRLEFDVNHL